MSGWPFFFMVVGITYVASRMFVVIDWLEGGK